MFQIKTYNDENRSRRDRQGKPKDEPGAKNAIGKARHSAPVTQPLPGGGGDRDYAIDGNSLTAQDTMGFAYSSTSSVDIV